MGRKEEFDAAMHAQHEAKYVDPGDMEDYQEPEKPHHWAYPKPKEQEEY